MDHIRRWLAAIGAMIVALLSGCMRAVPSIAPEKVQSQMVSVYLGQKNDDFVQAFLDGARAYLKQQDAVQLQLLESPEQLSEETDMVVTYEEEASCFASAELLLLEESESSIVALGKEIRQQLLSDLQERGAEVPQIYFLGANEAAGLAVCTICGNSGKFCAGRRICCIAGKNSFRGTSNQMVGGTSGRAGSGSS